MLPEGGESPPEFFAPRLREGAAAFGVALDARATERLARYLARLDRSRRLTNLTGPFPAEELVAHALESAAGACLIGPGTAVDIGSGAGFPGVPVAILRPDDVTVVPVEPRRLRREFLDGCGRELVLPNLAPARASLRELSPGAADAVLSRAVGDLPRVLGQAGFLKPGGALVAWTTDARALAAGLAPGFVFEDSFPVAGAARKAIARFRKA